jgi:molybdate transport system regulatory protein
MNRCWSEPLVEATPGGGEHRGARVTAAGLEVLAAYRALETAVAEAAEGPLEALRPKLLEEPKVSQHGE